MVGAITWKIWFTEMSIATMREGVGPSKNRVTCGGQNLLLERGNKTEKGDWCRNEVVATCFSIWLPLVLLFYSSAQWHLLCVWGK